MSALLFRLGRTSAHHPFRVLGLWLVAALAVFAFKGIAGGQFDDSFRVPGVESQHAADVLDQRFPVQGGQTARVVLHTDDGRLDDPTHRSAVDRARHRLSAGHDVSEATDPFAGGSAAISADGRTAYLDVTYAVDKLTATHLTMPLRSSTAAGPPASTSSSAACWPSSPRTIRAAS